MKVLYKKITAILIALLLLISTIIIPSANTEASSSGLQVNTAQKKIVYGVKPYFDLTKSKSFMNASWSSSANSLYISVTTTVNERDFDRPLEQTDVLQKGINYSISVLIQSSEGSEHQFTKQDISDYSVSIVDAYNEDNVFISNQRIEKNPNNKSSILVIADVTIRELDNHNIGSATIDLSKGPAEVVGLGLSKAGISSFMVEARTSKMVDMPEAYKYDLDKDGNMDVQVFDKYVQVGNVTKLDTCNLKGKYTLKLSDASCKNCNQNNTDFYEELTFIFDDSYKNQEQGSGNGSGSGTNSGSGGSNSSNGSGSGSNGTNAPVLNGTVHGDLGSGLWVEMPDGSFPKNQWGTVNGKKYYFDARGYAAANEYAGGMWFDGNGNLVEGYSMEWKSNTTGWWIEDKSGWYPVSRWLKIDGYWYYFLDSGYMDYSEYRDGCWLGSDGAMVDGYTNGTWHSNSTGWWFEDGGWYPTNQYLWIDGVQYWFNASGYVE